MNKIEHGISMPDLTKRGEVANIIRKMKVGDSIIIAREKSTSWYSTARVCNAKVAVRAISQVESRVWRVA